MNVLIIGGASGLGESITKKFAQSSAGIVYFTYSRSNGNARNIESAFSNTRAIKCDFKNLDDVQNLVKTIAELDIQVLVNNAYTGSFIKSYFHKTDPADFLISFQDNIIPTISITQAAINNFRKKKQGKIITVLTSALIDNPPIGSSVYISGKAYLEQLTKVWATENIKYNITSNSVSPAFMQTGFTSDMDERLVEQMKENHPLKKILTTEEVADALFLMSTLSSQMNGVNIVLNSGVNIR